MKTKLGISAGLVAAATVLISYFAGYVALLLILGYILICEENAWLKKTAVKVLLLNVAFSLIYALVNVLPDAVGALQSLLNVFSVEDFSTYAFNNFFYFITDAVSLVEKIVFIVIGITVIAEKDIKLPVVDTFVDKHVA